MYGNESRNASDGSHEENVSPEEPESEPELDPIENTVVLVDNTKEPTPPATPPRGFAEPPVANINNIKSPEKDPPLKMFGSGFGAPQNVGFGNIPEKNLMGRPSKSEPASISEPGKTEEASKSEPSTGIFGAIKPPADKSAAAKNLFGTPTKPQGLFGTAKPEASSGTGLFGSPKPTGLFGSTAPSTGA